MMKKLITILFFALLVTSVFADSLIQIRRDTNTNWATADPTLALGEIAYDQSTKEIKIGDGLTNWNALEYYTTLGNIYWGEILGSTLSTNVVLWNYLTDQNSYFAFAEDVNVWGDARYLSSGDDISELNNNSGYLTSVAYSDLTGSPSDVITAGDLITWDSDTLDVEDDLSLFDNSTSGFLTTYIDTNAETACGPNEYLSGSGSCDTLSYTVDTNMYTAGILDSDNNSLMIDLNINSHKIMSSVVTNYTFFDENDVFTVVG